MVVVPRHEPTMTGVYFPRYDEDHENDEGNFEPIEDEE